MFYRHWKKLALALTGFFWASCETSTSSEEVALYGCPAEFCPPDEPGSSSSNTDSSGSVEQNSSDSDFGKIMPLYGVEARDFSSSSHSESSSSSDIGMSMPLYGVSNRIACTQKQGESAITCDDGATCQQVTQESWGGLPCDTKVTEDGLEEICPDYGIVQISENTYECDGKTYNEAEFRARYQVTETVEPEQDSTYQEEMQPVLYGPPCVFNGTCNDDKE